MPNDIYTAYGLTIESQLALPELVASTDGIPDVTIRYEDVPACLPAPVEEGVAWQAAPGAFLLRVDGVARYLVLEGREIRVERAPDSTDDDVRVFLLGSVLGALLHQRNMLTLHASAIATEKGAVLFMGRSGHGKSTLLAAFLERGYAMLADDKAGVILGRNGSPQVLPGLPINRLWADVVDKLGYSSDALQPARQGLKKYVLPVDRFCSKPLPIYIAYELASHNREEIRLEPVQGVKRFEVMGRNTFRPKHVHALGQGQQHFKLAAAVANTSRVMRIIRPSHLFLLDELVTAIEEDLS